MKLYEFPNPWDFHEIGAFVVIASSPLGAARRVNAFLRSFEATADGPSVNYFPGFYSKHDRRLLSFTAEEAVEVKGGVFVAGGCDD